MRTFGLNDAPCSAMHYKPAEQDPLLDVSPREKAHIAISNLISGFSILSGASNFIADNVAKVPTLVQAGAFTGLGIVGGVVGGVQTYKEIDAEKDKALKLNKELFLIFNLAADKLILLKNSEKIQPENQEHKLLSDAYHTCLTQIHAALSSPSTVKREDDIDRRMEKIASIKLDIKSLPRVMRYSPEHNRINGIIAEYVEHRKKSAELKLWENLKINNISSVDAQLANFFVDFQSEKQIRSYFKRQRKSEREEFILQMKSYKQNLDYLEVKHLKKAETLNTFNTLRAEITSLLALVYDDGNFQESQAGISSLFLKFRRLKYMHEDLIRLLNQDFKCSLQKPAAKLIDTINLVTTNDFIKRTLLQPGVADMFNNIFNEKGTFREFWRELPNKIFTTQLDEKISLHFEQLIYRGGKPPTIIKQGVLGLGVTVGLFYTGKGLYASALALGAAGIGSLGMGILVGALALGLALMCVYFYRKAHQTQSDREEFYVRLNRSRCCLFVNEQSNKSLTDIILMSSPQSRARLFKQATMINALDKSDYSPILRKYSPTERNDYSPLQRKYIASEKDSSPDARKNNLGFA